MRLRIAFPLFLFSITSALLVHAQQPPAQKQNAGDAQIKEGSAGADWWSYGGTYLSWRYSALDQINVKNAKRLVPVWMFQTGDYYDALQSTPIVMDGIIYLSTARNQVFALDGATGHQIWQYKYPLPSGQATGFVRNHGVAVGDGKVFMGTYDNYVVALDQKTGKEVWKVAADDASTCHCNITSAPLVVKDLVITGNSGEAAHRSYISAFNVKTGRMEWRFYTVPGPGEKGNETWDGDSWKRGGVHPWMTGSYDPDLNLIYWGLGNPDPGFYSVKRGGDNLYGASVVALDADTGKLRWYYQEVPHDLYDYDANWECVLIDREVRGRIRKLLVHFNKGGYAWVLDRETGQLIGTYPYAEYVNWITGITETGELVGRRDPVGDKPTYICPGNLGGKNWNQTAYSPRTGWLYVPALEMCNDILPTGGWVYNAPPDHKSAYSHIDAIDPVTGKRQWTVPFKFELLASMLATAGDVVFTGDAEGNFFALDGRTGQKLWNFQTGAGNRGGPVTYLAGGKQYVATPTGWGTAGGNLTTGLWPEAQTWHIGSTLVGFALYEEPK